MPRITFYPPWGGHVDVTVDDGTSVMRAALSNGVDGIVGECGGQAMCATCHVYIREPYLTQLPEVGDDEEAMLDFTAAARIPERSRLGCQPVMGPDLPAIEVDLPSRQV